MPKHTDKKAPPKRSNRQPFTQYGFLITAHSGKKETPNGTLKASHWHGTLTLETTMPVHDEVDAERELEVLLANGFLPFFGIAPALVLGITFTWYSRPMDSSDPERIGAIESVTVCSVQLNYLAGLDPVTASEAAYRLQLLYGENWQSIVNEQGR